jgi:regulator of CtrA degradation
MTGNERKGDDPVALGPRLAASGGFMALYREGMSLIEDVAAYLDGPGRADSAGLNRETALLYATESMRLTTRLMQLASWLLLQRAVNEGEITPDAARTEKAKVNFLLTPTVRGGPGFADLPAPLVAFITVSDRLFQRVMVLDRAERGEVPTAAPDAVATEGSIADQLSRLRRAFDRS